jgi:hypothetical protein
MAEVFTEHMLRVLGRYTKRAADELLGPLGLRTQEYDTMETISRWMAEPDIPYLTISAIARRMGVLVPSACDYVNWLQRAEYVREAAGRSRLLTAKGEESLEECRHALRHLNDSTNELFRQSGVGGLVRAFLKFQEREGIM